VREAKQKILKPINDSRRKLIAGLRENGFTYTEIGRRLGISRERVRQIDKGKSNTKRRVLEFDIMLMPGEVARMLGVHVNTVRRWADKGILNTYNIGPRGDRRFKKWDIDRFLTKNYSSAIR